ncbi:MAG: hypothetical protein L6Q77_07125 [Bacteroidetes bacterium]|nr:hypothetical protein [Bacteroidota bacterium]
MKITLFLPILFILTGCSGGFDHFITRNGDQLYDGNQPFHFVSYNIPNLHYLEDQLPFDEPNPWRLPDEFEIRDALKAVSQSNGKAARIYVLSVKSSQDGPEVIRHVEGPGKFNESAFRALDLVFRVAREEQVRLILPLVDNWKWWGGPAEYAAFRGKEASLFWTDPELKADFRKTIEFIVNRVNTETGIPYREDKTLLGWETGNELDAPYAWQAEMAAYLKSLDPNHLVIEGRRSRELDTLAVNDPNLDVMTTHHYQKAEEAIPVLQKNLSLTKGKKPFFIGEIGLTTFSELKPIIDFTVENRLAGVMLWSLRFRSRDGGFYSHTEWNSTMPYRWPGFSQPFHAEERRVTEYVREKAFEINGEKPDDLPVPFKPVMLNTGSVYDLRWQGSAGADSYRLERREAGSETWTVLETALSDAAAVHRPLYSDETAEPGTSYQYRVTAAGPSGESEPSEPTPVIPVTDRRLTDDLSSGKKMNSCDTTLRFLVTKDLRKAKEDRNRLAGPEGSRFSYLVANPVKSVEADAFLVEPGDSLGIFGSADGQTWTRIPARITDYSSAKNEYGFFRPVRYKAGAAGGVYRYIQFRLSGKVQPAHILLTY